ncbi:MAG: hypothetical protein WCR67_03820 [Bacilli bacterium]
MGVIEICTIIGCILVVGSVLGNYIYRRIKHLPTGDCEGCKAASSASSDHSRFLEEYRKQNQTNCSCDCHKD